MDYFKVSRFFLYLVPFVVVVVTPFTLFPFIVGKYAVFRGAIDLSFIFLLSGFLFSPSAEEHLKRLWKVLRSPLGIAVSIFTAAFLLACVFGVNFNWSFWSNFERGEGGLQIIHLYLLFLLLVTLFKGEKDWSRFLTFMVAGSILMVVYGYLASMNFGGFVGSRFTDGGYRFQGSIGNPAYVGAYLIFAFGYLFYLLFTKYRQKMKILGWVFFGVITAFLFSAFILTGTRGSFIGFVVGLIAALVYAAFMKPALRKWILGAIALILVVVGLLVAFQQSSFVKRIPGSRVFDISVLAGTFQTRAVMWQIAWDGFLARPVFGWGPENFPVVFNKFFNINYFDPSQGFGAWFDRAHSIIFDGLAETGAVGTVAYLGVFVVFFVGFFKSARPKAGETLLSQKPPFVRAILPALALAYLVQGLVLFDVLPIYINVFVLLAFGYFLFQRKELKTDS